MQNFQEENIRIHQFSNGLRLVYLPWNTTVAHTGIFISAGSRHELEQEQGLAHFIEHTLFKGTEKRSSVAVINCLERFGGELNAYTGREETVIHASFLAEYSQLALELMSDIVFHATFPEKEVEKEKEVVIDEINTYLDTPDEFIFDDFEEQLFKNQSFGRNILGTPEQVRKFSQSDILRFIHRNYATDRMVISYVGNKNFDEIRKIVQRLFDGSATIASKGEVIKPFVSKIFNRTQSKPVYQSHCVLGGLAPCVTADDFWAMSLLNNYIGGRAMNSVLNMALREKHGYTYSNESNFSAFSDIGIVEIYLATDPQTLPKCLTIIERELNKLPAITKNTLQKMQEQMCGQIALDSDSGLNQMLSIGRSLIQTDKVLSMKEVFEKINTVSLDAIHQVAENYLKMNNLNVLIYKPDDNE
ncbi:MAG: pitrilysin family protein [Bacteroidales bacterium]|nr:pitrilysin family protein [Bacteroidales bacterium]